MYACCSGVAWNLLTLLVNMQVSNQYLLFYIGMLVHTINHIWDTTGIVDQFSGDKVTW